MKANPEILASEFWAKTGATDDFPRNIEQAVALLLPLTIVKIPLLNVGLIQQWLKRRNLRASMPKDDCSLMGCLFALRGHGVVFIDGTDEPDEQRYTIAHETSHFILDYLIPRQHVIKVLGEQITNVLDGLREATPGERIDAILSYAQLGAHVHLMPRLESDKKYGLIEQIEDRADDLAFELVAPQTTRTPLIEKLIAQGINDKDKICNELAAFFGLPAHVFYHIASNIGRRRPVSFLEDALSSIRGRK